MISTLCTGYTIYILITQIRYEGTTAIHQRILDFAKSAGLPFQDDEPIRLGGASVKAVNPYATYSDIIARNDDKLFKVYMWLLHSVVNYLPLRI